MNAHAQEDINLFRWVRSLTFERKPKGVSKTCVVCILGTKNHEILNFVLAIHQFISPLPESLPCTVMLSDLMARVVGKSNVGG